MQLSNKDDVMKLLRKGLLFFNRAMVCVLSWEPIFDSAALLKEVHLVWVELVGLFFWLWDSLKVLVASKLDTPLYVPSRRDLGWRSNRVCAGWDIKVSPPKQMIKNVRTGLKVILLKFGTFFGACFKCN